mmetsp:Transcript_20110/g.43311  ORF Transcript_20110/g.43311 Transcript_20110/m.43311 type:complete len:200 (-) Transcript_20110:6506-7105(-)
MVITRHHHKRCFRRQYGTRNTPPPLQSNAGRTMVQFGGLGRCEYTHLCLVRRGMSRCRTGRTQHHFGLGRDGPPSRQQQYRARSPAATLAVAPVEEFGTARQSPDRGQFASPPGLVCRAPPIAQSRQLLFDARGRFAGRGRYVGGIAIDAQPVGHLSDGGVRADGIEKVASEFQRDHGGIHGCSHWSIEQPVGILRLWK